MISHRYKCIFIHIPRTAGTSVEHWIGGADWWNVEPRSKHLLASQARSLYRPYWDDYFKFSIVRDPIDRMLSCLQYGEHFGISIDQENRISLDGYYRRFGSDIIIEHDHRFYERAGLISERHIPGSVYGNILDETLDFVARYENLERDLRIVGETIGLPLTAFIRSERSQRKVESADLHPISLCEIEKIFRHDFERFGYSRRAAPAAGPQQTGLLRRQGPSSP